MRVVKPQLLLLEQDIKTYDFQIVTDKKKQSILSSKLASSMNNYNLAKEGTVSLSLFYDSLSAEVFH